MKTLIAIALFALASIALTAKADETTPRSQWRIGVSFAGELVPYNTLGGGPYGLDMTYSYKPKFVSGFQASKRVAGPLWLGAGVEASGWTTVPTTIATSVRARVFLEWELP